MPSSTPPPTPPRQAHIRGCSGAFGLTWQETKASLREVIKEAIHGYWQRVRATTNAGGRIQMIEAHRVRVYRPTFGYIAVVLCMNEKVEATISKVALWVIGTAVGGTLGYVAMIGTDLATNPYGLMAVICAFTFMVGCLSTHQLRLLVVMTLMTFTSVILCQFKGCCGATGSAKVYGARVLAVTMGCAVPVLLTNLILPWWVEKDVDIDNGRR
ncbi:hypothetical protein TSOC_007796 [Tetrabaena socialis]|uniref:Integral membrane bound transporter domain-containing protein n=1 Tax=Tetrabaena socialis TaxID=47790 RepID=A0A2J8A062_9CHLO|nr:hypothetical protein TSOC_007796 [Tetrabaena socialis]|eukprot:PNH05904.1 hypothetical protein TSOC_007796 [Tetrabaena socialis]